MQYVVEEVPAEKLIKGKKSAPVMEMGSSPPIDIWASSAGGWGRVIWKGGDVCAPHCVPLPPVRLRQQHLGECGLGVNEPKAKAPDEEGQAGRKASAAGSYKDVEGIGATVPREGTDSPVRTSELREPRKSASSPG